GLILGQTIAGFQSGGYTGNVGTNQVAGVVHGREYVFDAASTARIGVDNLEALRLGRAMPGTVVPFPTKGRAPASSGGITINAPVTVEGQPGMTAGEAQQQGEAVAGALRATIISTLEKES